MSVNIGDEPTAGARFELAYSRLAASDAEYSAKLARMAGMRARSKEGQRPRNPDPEYVCVPGDIEAPTEVTVLDHVRRCFPGLDGTSPETIADIAEGLSEQAAADKRGLPYSTIHARRQDAMASLGLRGCREVQVTMLAQALEMLAAKAEERAA